MEAVHTPEGENLRYHYNEKGLIGSVETKTGQIAFIYDDKARLSRIEYPNGLKITYNYEAGKRPKSIACQNRKGETLYREEYTYDKRGNIDAITDLDGRTEYKYDEICRVVTAQHPDGRVERFVYDACGNISSTEDSSIWAYNKDQELVQWGDKHLQYDAAGSLIRIAADAEFKWNALGQLTEVHDKKTGKVSYEYDPEGRRIETKTETGSTRCIYTDGRQLLAEYDSAGKVIASYVPNSDSATWVAIRKDGREYYPIRSYTGSLMAVVDDLGNVVRKFRYDSYGRVRDSAGTFNVIPEYAGRRVDGETGLVLFGNRYYSPELRRFLSADADPDRDGSFYCYALSNPLRFSDFTGANSALFPAWPNGGPPVHPFAIPKPPDGATLLPQARDATVSKLREIAATESHLESGRNAQQLLDRLDSGYINLEVYDKGARGLSGEGSHPLGTNTIRVYRDAIVQDQTQSFTRTAAGTAVHEGEHVFQNLNDKTYRGLIHEAPAFERGGSIDPRQKILLSNGQPSVGRVNQVESDYQDRFKGYTDPSNPPVSDAIKKDPKIAFADPENPRVNAVQELRPTYGNESVDRQVQKVNEVRERLSGEPKVLSGKSIVDEAEKLKALRAEQALEDATRSGFGSAVPKNAPIGAIEEAVEVAAESRAAKAISAAKNLATKSVAAGEKAIDVAAKGVNSASGILGGLAKKALPFIGPAIEIYNAKDAKDYVKAAVHAIPVIGQIVQTIEMAQDMGHAIGEAAADAYLRAKKKYDDAMKKFGDIAKAIAEMDDPNNPKRPKRRKAASDQLPTSGPEYGQLFGSDYPWSSPAATGQGDATNSDSTSQSGSGEPPQGGSANPATNTAQGGTSGSASSGPGAATNAAQGQNNSSNSNPSSGPAVAGPNQGSGPGTQSQQGGSSNPVPPTGPTNPLGEKNKTNAGASSGSTTTPPKQGLTSKPQPPSGAPNGRPPSSQPSSGRQASTNAGKPFEQSNPPTGTGPSTGSGKATTQGGAKTSSSGSTSSASQNLPKDKSPSSGGGGSFRPSTHSGQDSDYSPDEPPLRTLILQSRRQLPRHRVVLSLRCQPRSNPI